MTRFLKSLLRDLPYEARLRWIAASVIVISLAALGAVYIAQYGFNLQPCVLCLYQRWPYRIAAGVAVFAFILSARLPGFAWGALWLVPLSYLIGAGIALFQVGVEQHWWRGTESCVGADLGGLSTVEMLARINAAPMVRCDEIQFELFGISMAGYNGLLSLGLAVLVAVALFQWARPTSRRS